MPANDNSGAEPEMHERKRPDIGLMLYEELPAEFEEGIAAALGSEDVRVDVLRISSGPYAGLELYLPAAIGLYIASTYFGGLLKKAGEDHYLVLKDIAKRLLRRSSALRIRVFGSEGKVSDKPRFSMAYSITGEVSPRLNFKLVLRLEAEAEEAEAAAGAFLDMLRQLHEGRLSERDFAALMTHRPIGGVALVTFDPVEKRIVAVDGLERN